MLLHTRSCAWEHCWSAAGLTAAKRPGRDHCSSEHSMAAATPTPTSAAAHRALCSTLDSAGREVPGASLPHELPRETAVRMYETMVKLQTVDTIFYEAQRQVGT